MNKEEGNFYTFSESTFKTKIRNIASDDNTSLFYIIVTSKVGKSEICFVEISESDFNPNSILSLKLDLILYDALVVKTKSGFLLFGIAYENPEKIGRESVYFTHEFELNSSQKSETIIKPILKSKKINFTSLSQLNDSILITSQYEIFKFNLVDMKFDVVFELKKPKTNGIGFFKIDSKNKKIFVGHKNNLQILDENFQVSANLEHAHDNLISCVDFNVNKNNQILTCANESFLKFWDIRNLAKPNLVYDDYNTLIGQAAFNGFYDQLVLYSAVNGSVVIYSANSISSSILLRNSDDKVIPENRRLKTFESALDDAVNSVCWSCNDAWIFGAASTNKCYFDILPQKIKFETMF